MTRISRKVGIKGKRLVGHQTKDDLFIKILDVEPLLWNLHDLVVALNLVLLGQHGIDTEDMSGARAVARAARQSMDGVMVAWRETLEYAKGQRSKDDELPLR